ncbi:unnamed protein product [Adineta ricciae]|uniref:Uncharacterized protein n=1 Tax=Adineta ricciae TaxID=249248 RepID=A0A815DBP1_ADIRI|nr:unnamed protein product [Adineta ricciae]CAF1499969.1 unnamed protein product [Adineta ricciae]
MKSPSFTDYTHINITYSETLTCPCTKISIDYKEIVRINYTFHQVCSSTFVSSKWIDYIDSANEGLDLFYNDFRTISVYVFQVLKSFCEWANETVSRNLNEFYSNQYISAYLTTFDVFPSQVKTSVSEVRSSMINRFLLSFYIIRQTTLGNNLLSSLTTNYVLAIPPRSTSAASMALNYGDCSCATSATCIEQAYFYNYPNPSPSLSMPGMYIGCYVVEASLQSTLQCFYDQNCIDSTQSYLSNQSIFPITALNSSLTSNYYVNSTVNEILEKLMIEQWNVFIMYENYYGQCKPSECSYTYETRNDVIFIITTLIGLLGGLVTALKLAVPLFVSFVRRKKDANTQTIVLTIHERTSILWQTIKHSIQNLNLFPSVPPSNDEHQLRNEHISTRLFVLLFALSFTILLLYNSLICIQKTVTMKSPSFTDYTHINITYSETLTCPCTKISIDYKEIVRINYTFHQICSSVFITEGWIEYIYDNRGDDLWSRDFRVKAPSVFLLISKFCEMVNRTLTTRFDVFYTSTYTRSSVIPYNLFQSETKAVVEELKYFTISNLISSLSLIRQTTQSNSILSGTLSNYFMFILPNNRDIRIRTQTEAYGNCTCFTSSLCTQQSYIYGESTSDILFLIPGFSIGCYVLEALLQSTLQCFYDQNCIDSIQSYLSHPSVFPITVLNSSFESNYFMNSTVNEILEKLMIEQWNVFIMYENYYEHCKPSECSYTYETRNDVIFIITTLIGLLGGLVTALKLAIPLVVTSIAYCIRKCNMRIVPATLNLEQI